MMPPEIQSILDLIVPGVILGCLYGLVGMAFAIIYKATRVVNFALGEVMMLIAYISFSIQSRLNTSFLSLVLIAILVSAAVGLTIEFLVVRPMRGRPLFSIVMTTIGLAIVLRSVVAIVWGSLSQVVVVDLPVPYVSVLGVSLTTAQMLVAVLLLLACTGSALFFRFTRMGLFMRATASSEGTAHLLGIKVGQIHTLAWIGSTVIAGLTGVMIAMVQNLGPELYLNGFKGFPATILGGLDSIGGSAVGGILIGLTESATARYIGSGAKEVAGLLIIVVVLMVRPYGLFGQRAIERV